MPIFDQGYQHWRGELAGHLWRWWAITRRGLRAQLKNRWVIAAVLFAWVPALALAALLAVWGLFEQKSAVLTPFLGMFREALPGEMFSDPHYFRSTVWTIAFDTFFRFEIFFSMILVLLVGPDLISQDLRFNAMPLYFSKPVRRFDYFLGKLGIITVFLLAVTAFPAASAWLLGVCFSLDFGVFQDTMRLCLASLIFSGVIAVSAGTLMLSISSLSRNSRYVGAMWVGLWVVSNVMAAALDETLERDWCPVVSYTHNLARVGNSLLGTHSAWQQIEKLLNTVRQPRRGGPFAPPGRPAPAVAEPAPSTARERRRDRNSPFAEPHPWTWSAGTLAGLFVLSTAILTQRVKNLDELK
jgi:ABC-2 type transport system permease protein